jgi:putative sigma-54 modulation protein
MPIAIPGERRFQARRRSVQINISARHGHLSTQTQALVTEKVEKIKKFHDRITAIVVTCDLEHKEAPEVEVRVTCEHAGEFVATDKSENLLAALDGAMHKAEQQLKKHKEKITEHRAVGHRELAGEAEAE